MLRERCIPIDSPDEWEAAISGLPHSVVHTWRYCRSIWLTSGRRTFLYCLENHSTRVVCPLSERERDGCTDVVTPYGIGGFTGFGDAHAVRRQWLEFAERRYVAGYVSLNPLFAEAAIHAPDATREKTVYVLDLRQSTDELFSALSENRKRQLRPGAVQDDRNLLTDRSAITEFFAANYASFMDRKQATQVYRLTPESLRSLCNLPTVLLIGAGRPGHIEAAAMFGHSPFSGDYLFGLSISGAQVHSALLLWWGARMMKTMGIPFLNLGGGVHDGDSLAEFKRRFGGLELPLKSLRQIYRPAEYADLCRKVSADPGTTAGYFPAYHKPG